MIVVKYVSPSKTSLSESTVYHDIPQLASASFHGTAAPRTSVLSKTSRSRGNNSFFERIPTKEMKENELEEKSSVEEMHYYGVPIIVEEKFEDRSNQLGTVSNSDGSDPFKN